MSALLMAAVLAAAPLETAAASPTSPTLGTPAEGQAAAPRTGRPLRQAARECLRRWARPADDELESAAEALEGILHELEADTELAASLREPLVRQVRGRLAELARRQQREVAAARRAAGEPPAEGVGGGNPRPLAQFGGGFPGGFQGGFQGGGFQGGGFQGGGFPGAMGGGMGMGMQGQPRHHGEELLELIQSTIRPNSWERVGGPGTIYFFR